MEHGCRAHAMDVCLDIQLAIMPQRSMARTSNWLGLPEHELLADGEPRGNTASERFARFTRTMTQQATKSSVIMQLYTELVAIMTDTKLNMLLLAMPFAFLSKWLHWGDSSTFLLSMIALCPLAERLGFITEHLAMYTNDTLGGLLNASFGNATEVIIAAFALKKGYLRIVQLTLLGSIVSNLLLVLGSAFVAGGMNNKTQKFNQQGVNVNCGLLVLSAVAVLLPSLLSETHTEVVDSSSELALSRFQSVILLLCYGLYLVFQLCTHRHLYEQIEEEGEDEGASAKRELEESLPLSKQPNGHPVEVELTGLATVPEVQDELESSLQFELDDLEGSSLVYRQRRASGADNDDDEKVLTLWGCFFWLTLVTLVISVLSDYIMQAIKGAAKHLKVPMPFLTTILVPIVGNAAEHASAIVFAYKNRIEIALGVAIGSSTQIAVLVVPFCVLLGWCMGQPLDLNYNSFEALVLFASVLLTIIVVSDGHANWLKGAMLIMTYVFVAAGFWVHKDKDLVIGNYDDVN